MSIPEEKERYFRETAVVLGRGGFQVERGTDSGLRVRFEGEPLCEVTEDGGIIYRMEDAAYHVVEHGQDWYFKTTPGEELLAVSKKLRSYITSEKGAAPDLFIKMFAGGHPITTEEYNAMIALRMENTGKVRGVFDINFDKREFSAVHIMDGWQTWAMRDVSAAVYHATRSQFAPDDDKWCKLLNHLEGKEITSAGHLTARNFSFSDEIIELDGKLNFYGGAQAETVFQGRQAAHHRMAQRTGAVGTGVQGHSIRAFTAPRRRKKALGDSLQHLGGAA